MKVCFRHGGAAILIQGFYSAVDMVGMKMYQEVVPSCAIDGRYEMTY